MSHLLEPLGLSADDSSIYRHVLGHPNCHPDEIARELSLPTLSVRACVRHLTAMGLCSRLSGPHERYFALPPEKALEPLVMRREQDLAGLRAHSRELALRVKAPLTQAAHLIETIEGRDAVLAKITELELGARQQVCVIDSPPYLEGPVTNANELHALSRGVAYRAVYHAPSLAEPGYADLLDQYIAAGELARSLPQAQLKMLLVDGEQALVPLSFTTQDATVRLLIGPSPLLDALLIAFESLWEKATQLGPMGDTVQRPVSLGARDQAILRLMAAGIKDRAIARALGISERTVLRRIQQLMTDLDATTRFQAGVRALAAGWLGTTTPPGTSSY
ncbi:helix-turn-helix transcriptional regulator [Streptomyces hundungensis]|uniref:helix-turn-helix transcriptional regulator n=1 Tax=Streptomyces hundungensis TaxID=1077946 RepID=UPI0033D42706